MVLLTPSISEQTESGTETAAVIQPSGRITITKRHWSKVNDIRLSSVIENNIRINELISHLCIWMGNS